MGPCVPFLPAYTPLPLSSSSGSVHKVQRVSRRRTTPREYILAPVVSRDGLRNDNPLILPRLPIAVLLREEEPITHHPHIGGWPCYPASPFTPSVPTPSADISTAHSWHAQHSATTVMTAGRRLSIASAPFERRKSQTSVCVGKMILDMLPCKVDVTGEKAARSPTVPRIAQPRPVVATLPTVQLPATPPQLDGPSFPRVVVVNPTPHPTPPATPSITPSPTVAAQPSTHLLPPPPARSLLSVALAAPPLSASTKPSKPSKAVSPPQLKEAVVSSSLKSKLPPHDGISASSSKSKQFNDDTLKASDRRFFLPDGGSPSPERSPSADSREETHEHDHDHEQDNHSPSSGTSSHIKSELAGHTSALGGGPKRPRVQVRKSKERHAPTRPTLQRLHSHGLRQSSQKKAAPPSDTKKTTFNIGSVSSNGSRSGKAEKEKEKGKESSKTRPLSPTPAAAPTPANPLTNTGAKADGAGPSQQRRGIVISTSSEYETTDSDDDSEWASEDSSEDRNKARKAQTAEEVRVREAAEEEVRQRDMFAKVPKRSYSNLNRTKSGLLSQLLNPDPNIFPPNHPYRQSRSTQDMTQWRRQGGASLLTMSKSSAAVPLAAQVTAQAPVVVPKDNGQSRQVGYRPKGRPQGEEMEDTESDDENPDDTIQVSRSLAQQKLAALTDPNRRRRSDHGMLTQQQQQMQQVNGRHPHPHPHHQHQHQHQNHQLPTIATAPIPLTHPYNLPAPAPPMTPRTTRRQMLQTELSESLRRNLLWERQVSRTNLTARRAGNGVLGSGIRPLTAMTGDEPAAAQQQQQQQQNSGGSDQEERRRRAMARNRSWADDFHTSGW
ncbi:hypothetical protein C8Q80DRAFT_610330 [Daedaleopsis nitida]|nr:hypothetical protein C8Q80DRAFT_610330 [Daedaleopsis nitida]